MKKPSLGWQSWSSPFPKWHGFPLWDYSPVKSRKIPHKITPKKLLNIKYWCSWYAYGWDITQSKIEETLKIIQKNKLPFTHILIDDGWTTWGDWHTPEKSKFTSFQEMMKQIRSNGLKIGLWFAPFLASKNSQLFKEHPEWFIKHKGKPIQGLKIFPLIDWFLPHEYLLNVEKKAVKKYLTDFIDKAVKEWKVDLLKLDFLYANYFNPVHKSDHIPHRQVSWILQYIHTKYPHVKTIASGTPFAPVIDTVSSMRISQDTALPQTTPSLLNKIIYGIRVNTLALKYRASLLIRHQNIDPDVRMFRLDTTKTNALWSTISTNIQGIGDDLTKINKNTINKMRVWLKN